MTFHELFALITNMSLTASVIIVAVLLVRLPLKRAPKVFSYALWAAVLFRLLCPVSIESPVGVVPQADVVPPAETFYTVNKVPVSSNGEGWVADAVPFSADGAADLAAEAFGSIMNGASFSYLRPRLDDDGNLVTYKFSFWHSLVISGKYMAKYVWAFGIGVLALYSVAQYKELRRRLTDAILLRDNIYLSDHIDSPFVMGLFRPKIYLPLSLSGEEQEYIILHERHHIRRGDHVVRILAFAALCIHWFNPLVWLAYIQSGKDMEMSCDEAVMKKMDGDIRADYSMSLLRLATGKRVITGTPLAFGEGDTKQRVKNVMSYRKPAFWIVLAAIAVCIVAVVCLLTAPGTNKPSDGAIGRMETVTADDLKYISCERPNEISAEELAQALNDAAERRVDDSETVWYFWNVTAYLSGGPDGYSSDTDEHFYLYAGLDEDIVRILYGDGSGGSEEIYVEDESLYWLIRSNYRNDGTIDPSFEQYRDIIEARAQEDVEKSAEYNIGGCSFSGYEVTYFKPADTFEAEGEQYDVYSYSLAFTVDDPTKVGWVGGMYLDSELRVCAYDEETYLVVRSDSSGQQEHRFLFYDLYFGPDEETGRENAWETIQKAFEVS